VARQVLGGRTIAHLGIDEAVYGGRVLLKGAAKRRGRGRSTGVRGIGAALVRLPRHALPSFPWSWSVAPSRLYIQWCVTELFQNLGVARRKVGLPDDEVQSIMCTGRSNA